MKRNLTFIFILLAALNFTHILDFMIMMPLGNYLVPFFKISEKQFTLLVSAYAISAGVSSFISAFFVNQFDRKVVLIFAYIGFLLGTLACGLSPTYNFLLGSRVVAGIFGGLIGAQVIAIISDLVPFEKRGQAMGIVMSAFAAASTLGVPLALHLANIFSWHAPFILVACMGVFVLVALFFGIPPMAEYIQKDTGNRVQVLSRILNDKKQTLALCFSFMMFFGHFVIIPFINPFLEFNKGFSKMETPQVYLFGGLAAFLSSYLIGKLADKYGKLKTFAVCTFLSLPLVILVTHLPDMKWQVVLVIFAIWFMFSTGRAITSQSLISNVSPPQFRGSFQSFNSFVQQIGSGLAAFVAGLIVSQDKTSFKLSNYEYLGYLSLFILAAAIGLGFYIFREDEKVG
jgi:MFS transporter, DHA1 family, inner membrane transport protein